MDKLTNLTQLKKGESGVIYSLSNLLLPQNLNIVGDVELYLLDMGFMEGVILQVLHLGWINHDPIAVRINNNSSIIALRKREAAVIILKRLDNGN